MATEADQQLDSIFHALGPLGRFTKLQIVLIWLGVLPTAFQLLSNVFIGPEVSHRCARPANESELVKDYLSYGNVTVRYDECHIRLLSNTTVIKSDECLFGTEYDLPRDSSFISQFDLVCGSTNLARLTQTLVIGGQAFGAVTGALLADRLGRKTVMVASNFGLLATGLAIAFSPNYLMFAVFKFLVGGFQQALVAVNATMMLELMVIADRRLAAVVCGMAWATGVILLDAISFAMKGYSWRNVQMVLSLGSIPGLLQIWYLRESLRWLLANGKTERANQYVKFAAELNGKKGENVRNILDSLSTVGNENQVALTDGTRKVTDVDFHLAKATKKLSYFDIFLNRHLLRNTLVMWIAWFTTAFGFFAIYLSSTNLAGDVYLNFFLTALMEIPSNILFYFGLNRYGRKAVLLCVFVSLSVGLIGSGIFRSLEQTTTNSILAIVCSMIAMGGASGCFGIVFHYTPELFPTNIRNQALGISSMVSRIGGMMAPFTGVLSEKAKWGPGLLIGCLASIVAVLTRLLPETRGKQLPQTMEDLNSWFYDNNNAGVKKKKMKENRIL